MKKSLIVTEALLKGMIEDSTKDKFYFKELREKAKRYIVPMFTTNHSSSFPTSVQQYDVIILQIKTLSLFFDSIIFGVIPYEGENAIEIYTSHDDLETAGALATYLGFNRFYDKFQKRQIDCVGEYKTLGVDFRLYWDKGEEKTKKQLSHSNPPTDEPSRSDNPGQYRANRKGQEGEKGGLRK